MPVICSNDEDKFSKKAWNLLAFPHYFSINTHQLILPQVGINSHSICDNALCENQVLRNQISALIAPNV